MSRTVPRAPRARARTLACLSVVALVAASAPLVGGLVSSAVADDKAPKKTQESAGGRLVLPKLAFEKYTLANGLEVILHQDRRTPTVAVNVWYHVGSKDEPANKNGFAHLFEHLMFQGSRNVGEDKFFFFLEKAGASERNGTTNTDRTNYFETVPANELALALWLESDRMGFLLDHVHDKTFEEQRNVVKNERRQNYENAPYGLVLQFVRAALYPKDHPYHLLTIGTPEDLDRASLDDVKAFYRRYYVPNNATLVVAGDFEPAKAKALVAKYFGSLKKGADPGSLKKPVAAGLASEKRLAVEADVELARITIAWPTPAHYAPGDGELDLAASILAEGTSSRLHKRLVYDLQMAQSVWAHQSSGLLGSQFDIGVSIRKGHSAERVLAIVDEELDKLRTSGPTAVELSRAQTSTLSSLVFALESLSTRANWLNQYNQRTGDPGYLEKDVARYERAAPSDVQKAVASHLPKDKRVVAVVTPTPGAPRAGRLVEGK
jgi:zinc protease